jgi:hypothetical protein
MDDPRQHWGGLTSLYPVGPDPQVFAANLRVIAPFSRRFSIPPDHAGAVKAAIAPLLAVRAREREILTIAIQYPTHRLRPLAGQQDRRAYHGSIDGHFDRRRPVGEEGGLLAVEKELKTDHACDGAHQTSAQT